MTDLEAQVRAWADAVDRPIAIEEVERPSGRPGPRVWIAAAVVAVAALVAGGMVLIGDGGSTSNVETIESPASTSAPTTATSVFHSVPELPLPAGESMCPGLESESTWADTGDRSRLNVGAGTSARYVEVVTNTSADPCTLETNRCGSTAALRTPRGTLVLPENGCELSRTTAILGPGEERTETLSVEFPIFPGDYTVRVGRYDGTTVDLPVRLDDRVPPCAPEALHLRDLGEQAAPVESLRSAGWDLQLVVETTEPGCSLRIAETRVAFETSGTPDAVDDLPRWQALQHAVPGGASVLLTHAELPPTDIPVGRYAATVTVTLEDGGTLQAPLALLVD